MSVEGQDLREMAFRGYALGMVHDSPVALVTGGAKRVGRATALRLAEGGYDVAITYLRSEAEVEEVLEGIRRKGRRAVGIRVDLTHPAEAVEAIGGQIEGTLGRLDLLMNNASIYEPGDDVTRMMAIHVEAPLLLCRRFAGMLRAAKGRVINMVDLMGERPVPTHLAYCASKAALANLTVGLARELAPEVTVNGIAPGVVDWPVGMTMEQREAYLKRVPLGRAGTPEDVAELVWFLAGGGAYITGQIIRLDGGRSIL